MSANLVRQQLAALDDALLEPRSSEKTAANAQAAEKEAAEAGDETPVATHRHISTLGTLIVHLDAASPSAACAFANDLRSAYKRGSSWHGRRCVSAHVPPRCQL